MCPVSDRQIQTRLHSALLCDFTHPHVLNSREMSELYGFLDAIHIIKAAESSC